MVETATSASIDIFQADKSQGNWQMEKERLERPSGHHGAPEAPAGGHGAGRHGGRRWFP